MRKLKSTSFETLAVHAGERTPASDATPVVSPIWPATTYLYENMDDMDAVFEGTRQGPLYLRYSSPTVSAFEAAVAALEGAEDAQAYSSGMAAVHSTLLAAGAKAGAAVVAALDVYGATFAVLNRLLTTLGVHVRMVNINDLAEVEEAVKQTHACILLAETISNPLLKVADVPRLAQIAHQNGADLLVDNTFASPYLYNPLRHGADYSMHSATKYLSGHGDVLAGVVATSAENKRKLNDLNKLIGGVLGPFEAWLALRGLKTLPLRVKRQCENAQIVADWLAAQPRVSKVNYPGLQAHPQHALAGQLFEGKGYGGVLSFEITEADKEDVFRFMEALSVCLPGTSLGDIYSLVLHPA
ncbi:MAG TPA: PLP-dependent aspartate aminotransferase family protein, partial [Anaerolineales bacterium]|nr:PLP-dependent aspartate aminotransferase family protein [Anaerolineales bacterium]